MSSAFCVRHGHTQTDHRGCVQCWSAVSVRCQQCGTLTTLELVLKTTKGEIKVCPKCWRAE